jgi:CTP:molybdopterin cytidylyltransferase MocA
VRVAARVAEGSDPAIPCNVDQPLRHELVALLLGAARARPDALVICPEAAGRRIHPVLFRAELFSELAEVNEQSLGLRAVVAAHSDRLLAVAADPAWAPPHFNYPEEYEAARAARFEGR